MNDTRKSAYSKANKTGKDTVPIRDYTYDELEELLITEDGVGSKMKREVLNEIHNRDA